MGRPSSYTPEIADEICDRISSGESLRAICRDEAMPEQRTVFRWLAHPDRDSFRQQYARAREAQADAIVDEMFDIADDGRNDWMEKQLGEDGPSVYVLNGEHVQRSKLRIDARKWMAGKLAPKKYGDRQEVNLKAQVSTLDMTEDEIKAELAALVGQGFAPPAVLGDSDDGSDLV